MLHEHIANSVNLVEDIYDVFRQKIINFDYEPGEKISETNIAALFKVSRTPVREAFKKLVFDGLLDVKPQRGTFISYISISKMKEGLFLREALEIHAIKNCVKNNLFKPYFDYLENLIHEQEIALKNKDADEFFILDEKFHSAFFEACNFENLTKVSGRSNVDYSRIRILCMQKEDDNLILCKQHKDILQAIKENDLQLAETSLCSHLNRVWRLLKVVESEKAEYFSGL